MRPSILDLAFVVPGMPFNGDTTLLTQSLGGSETAGLCLARELAKRGHNVQMFCNTDKPGEHERVVYNPLASWTKYVGSVPHDVTIVQRMPEALVMQTAARLNFLWCHDMALGRATPRARGTAWNIDRFAVVSKYMADQYRTTYDLPDDYIFTSRNGIDPFLFAPYRKRGSRRLKRLVYAARPERGLDVLLERIMPELLRRDPEFQLILCGYNNPVDHLQQFYAGLMERVRTFNGAVRQAGFLSKPDLYRLYSECGLYVYPTPSPTMPTFRETSCISVMEAMAAGLPVVTSDAGALGETLAPQAGTLVPLGDGPMSDGYVNAFCDAVMEYLNNADKWQQASEAGYLTAPSNSWAAIAAEWEAEFERAMVGYNDSPARLFWHFRRRTDIMAAAAATAQMAGPERDDALALLDKEYGWVHDPAKFAEHYRSHGEDTDARLAQVGDKAADMFKETGEQRFHILERGLAADTNVQRVLDYGCGHGWCSIYLHNRVGRTWVGVDIDPGAVRWAQHYAQQYASKPDALTFLQGDHTIDLSGQQPFDMLLLTEVLEHVANPVAVVEALEKHVRPGGTVVITVPYGPGEYDSHNWHHFRNHLWEFDPHDLRDLFGDKSNLEIYAVPEGVNDTTAEPKGFTFLKYTADHRPLGAINWERKLSWQRPRQTLSVAIMAGGPLVEETAHWCLRSVRRVADEIVVVDTGMTPEARRIVEQYDVRLVAGSNPLEHGFETPRNEALDACRMDWALWIDVDEKLLDTSAMPKYLRENLYDGYSIRQHHFAADTSFQADMPVRLIRRGTRRNGKRLRFYGMIHEHPEFGVNEGPGHVIILSDVHIAHVGYLVESTRRTRFWRNAPMLQRDIDKYPDRRLQKHFICRDLSLLNVYELQQNGGAVTPAIRARCEEIKKLYREHFLGKSALVSIDTLQYYSSALEILGEGISVAFDMQVQRDGLGDAFNGHGTRARFASADEAVLEVGQRLADKMKPFSVENW